MACSERFFNRALHCIPEFTEQYLQETGDFRLQLGAVVLLQVEHDAQTLDGVILVIGVNDAHHEQQQLLDVRLQDFVVGQAVEDLEDHVSELVDLVVDHLRGDESKQ